MMTHKRISINSVRRAMSDLTRQRFLSKLNKLKEGPWGKPEHYWELNLNQAL
jgi:transcription initiation factor IIE alpha subunit